MSARGLGSLAGAPPRTATRGNGLQARIDALEEAVSAARGRVEDEVLDAVETSVARSTARLKLSAAHTVVAIAGATGSGKSSIFNALAGVELSSSGARRPTTSTAKALVWSDDDLAEMLEWLGVPAADQCRRATLSPPPSRGRLPDGLVLLDLPDHDSVQVAHHEEAERVVELADLLIWVVDPQKYADAAIHQRFLQPLAGHRAVTMVVLNHIDTVPEDRRPAMLRDLRKVLAADGIRDPRILATSARDGTGMKELRSAIRRRVEEKQNAALRVEADIRAATVRLQAASGEGPSTVPAPLIADLERRVAEASGIPGLVVTTARLARKETVRRMALPRRRTDASTAPPGPRLLPVDRRAVDVAVRALVDHVCHDLTPAWESPIRAAATERLAETDDRLDAELAALRFQLRLPGWLPAIGLMRAGALATAVVGVMLLAAWMAGLVGATVPLVVLVLSVLVGATAAAVGRFAADRVAAQHSRAVDDACRRTIARVVRGQVVAPMQVELASYARFHRGVCAARA